MKIAFNPSTVAALTSPPDNKDITFDLRGHNIFARGVKFQGTDTNTWRDIKINNVSIGSNVLDLRNGSNTTLTNTNGVVTINSTWRPVVDNLTSNSTTSSLSANQGRVLAGLINGKSNSDHNHDDRYVRKSGDTMQGVLTIDTPNFGALVIKRNDDYNGASIKFRGKSKVYGYVGFNSNARDKQFLRWNSDTSIIYTILDTSSTYISNGKGVINGTTITQVDNATNSTNSTNARKLVNWYSTRPTSLNAQFGDGSLRIFYATSSTTEGKPAEDSHILHLAWDNTSGQDAQLAVHVRSGKVSTRAQNAGTWQPWKTLAFITDIPTSLKNPYSFNVFGVTYDGSAAKTVTTSNFISQVNESTSTITDGTMLITSYASNSGFADTNAVNVPYKRQAIHLWEYIKAKTDSRYYTESEVDSLLNTKLNRQNLSQSTWNPRGYNFAASYTYNGGSLSLSEKYGQIFVSINGYFWQNEGKYRVLDTSDVASLKDDLTVHQHLSATDNAWYPLIWGGSSHANTNDSTGAVYKSHDKLSWQTSSQTLYTTRLQTTDIIFSNSGTSMRGIQDTVGDKDFQRIKGGATASNSGYLEIATANDGNEPIYVRQYTGVFSTIKRTLTLLDANGFTHFPSYINIGGNENNNSSPDRVWGSNSSDSYLRSYRTSALNVNYASRADSATKLQTPRTIWGKSFDGTSNVSGSLSEVGDIQFSTSSRYSIGTTTSEAAHVYTRQVWARHLNANRDYTGDTNLYIGYYNTAGVKFFSDTKQTGQYYKERMTISTNGNVGIGFTEPANKLTVNGSVRVMGPLILDDTIKFTRGGTLKIADMHMITINSRSVGFESRAYFKNRAYFSNGIGIKIGLTNLYSEGLTTSNHSVIIGEYSSSTTFIFEPAVDGQLLFMKLRGTRPNVKVYCFARQCVVVKGDSFDVLIGYNTKSDIYGDGVSRFFIYESAYNRWIEFRCN